MYMDCKLFVQIIIITYSTIICIITIIIII